MSGMSGYCDPEYPDSSPEYPGNYYSFESFFRTGVSGALCPEYLDIYPEYPGTLLPMASFCERGYKYPPIPLHLLLSCPFRNRTSQQAKESSLTSPLPFLSDFLKGFK
jgi:hypothetical protein